MFKVQLNFSRDELTRLFTSALSNWAGYAKFDSVTINCDRDGRVYGYAFLRKSSKTTMVNFSHDVIVAGVSQGSAAKGNPLADGSLVFTYHEGHGHGGGSTVTAVANPGTQAAAAAASTAAVAGKVKFPGIVTVSFSKTELPELLMSAARRAGSEPVYATVSYSKENGTSANISVKTAGGANGSISLTPPDLIQALTEELSARGYTVAEDGFRFSYTEGGHGSGGSGTSVTVSLSVLPL